LIAVNAPIFLFEVCAAINCGSSWGNLGRRPESRGADGPEGSSESLTPDFPKKTKCKPICMPGSSFIHIVT
jgi:hypothetical protein